MDFYPEFSGNVSDKTEFVLVVQNSFMPWTALSGKFPWFTAKRDIHMYIPLHTCILSPLLLGPQNEIHFVC